LVRTSDPDRPHTRTQARHSDHPDSDYGPGARGPSPTGPSPDDIRTRTTQTQTRTAPAADTEINDLDGPSPDDTRTRTRADLLEEIAVRRRLAETIKYPGGWLARQRAAAEARRRATETAIERGAEAELFLLEAKAAGDLAADDDDEQSSRWEQFAAGWPQVALTIAVAIVASVGQIQFAKENGAVGMIDPFGVDLTPWFAPAVLDLSVAALYARGMHVAVRYKASPWLPWAAGTAIGIFSIYTNTKHEHAALLFAGASAVGVVCWMVALLLKYWNLPHVKARRATAKPRLMTSALVFASRATAKRAWVIARRRPITMCAAEMRKAGKNITERDLVIQAAELFNTVRADRQIAELAQVCDPPGKDADKRAKAAWEEKRDLALARAEIVAWDAVDVMLGLDVIKREGIQVNQVTYNEPAPRPLVRKPAMPIATDAAPAAPVLPAAEPRRRPAQPPARRTPAAPPADNDVVTILLTRPPGQKYRNWLRLSEIPGLPEIDPEVRCTCGASAEKRCGETLVQHVERRGEQIRAFVAANPDWASRPDRIQKKDVELLGVGSSTAMDTLWLMNQLRDVVAAAGHPDAGSAEDAA
jgi:hypothetical protein